MRELKNMDCLSYFLTFLLLVAVFNVAKGQPLVTALFIFGDSVVDAGNNNNLYTVVKANFPPYGRDFNDHKPTGRFCNGKLASDYTAESLGFNSYPPAYLNSVAKGSNLFNGANFASAASGYYDPTAKLYVRKGCCGTGLLEASILCNQKSIETCANASEYVFWDGVHLSQVQTRFWLMICSLLASLSYPNPTLFMFCFGYFFSFKKVMCGCCCCMSLAYVKGVRASY